MKHNKAWVAWCIMLLGMSLHLKGAPGCQDNSLHMARCSIDYKNWHYVACDCPCELSYDIRPDGHCSECEHLRRVIRLVHPEEIDPTAILNIAKLKAYCTAR